MKVYKICVLIISFLSLTYNLKAQLEIDGRYQGKNIFVQNPSSTKEKCVTHVAVNGQSIDVDFEHSAFEIELTELNLQVGEEIKIGIKHNENCNPKVLNPDDILPKSTFELLKMKIDPKGTLNWKTKGEKGALVYQVQIYRWNKWINVGKVTGTGEEGSNSYSFSIKPHAGKNKVRILQVDYSGNKRKSPEKTFESSIKSIELLPSKDQCKITFLADKEPVDTHYELYDTFGNLIKKGFSNQVNCESLAKGDYHINFDNTKAELIKDQLIKIKTPEEKEKTNE